MPFRLRAKVEALSFGVERIARRYGGGGRRFGRRRVARGRCWQPVASRLRASGYDAYPFTLTGLGERAHLGSPEVDLETHITGVVNLVEFEDLHDIVLLGHSYAGLVVTGAADRIPERISKLVYLGHRADSRRYRPDRDVAARSP